MVEAANKALTEKMESQAKSLRARQLSGAPPSAADKKAAAEKEAADEAKRVKRAEKNARRKARKAAREAAEQGTDGDADDSSESKLCQPRIILSAEKHNTRDGAIGIGLNWSVITWRCPLSG